jgi:hypothetical protein
MIANPNKTIGKFKRGQLSVDICVDVGNESDPPNNDSPDKTWLTPLLDPVPRTIGTHDEVAPSLYVNGHCPVGAGYNNSYFAIFP